VARERADKDALFLRATTRFRGNKKAACCRWPTSDRSDTTCPASLTPSNDPAVIPMPTRLGKPRQMRKAAAGVHLKGRRSRSRRSWISATAISSLDRDVKDLTSGTETYDPAATSISTAVRPGYTRSISTGPYHP